jgi:hypothetical protein
MKRINSYLRALKHRLWIRGMADAETLTEIEGHLMDAMDKGVREGLSAEEAEQRAIERFGSVQTIIGSFEKERLNIMNKILLVVAILCGLFLAYVDSSPGWDDTGITAGGLLVATGLITLLGHPRPWLIGLAVGIWIPLLYIYQNQAFSILFVLIIPMIGAYAGWAVRLGVRKTLHLA